MKLLNHSTKFFAGILLLVLALWAIIFYYQMLDEIYDSMDDGLENQKMLVVRNAKLQSEVNLKADFGDGYYTIHPISRQSALKFQDQYRDTLMYMHNENDFEPVRLLESVFRKDQKYYKVKVITSMVEEDDLVEDLFFSLVWLYIGLIVTILLLNNFLLRKIWDPFYKLLNRLRNFKIEKDHFIRLEKTNIEEFQYLNQHISDLIDKSVKTYQSQKQFIENASHELQTPLAISLNKLELLLEKSSLQQKDAAQLISVIENLERLSRLNNSLLLLSKIENNQFTEMKKISLDELTRSIVENFEDLAAHKNVEISIETEDDLIIEMNQDLLRILLTNLIKNAIIHDNLDKKIKIKINSEEWTIFNSGDKPLNPEIIFTRFRKSNSVANSTGLGLAISKAIAHSYNLQLEYKFQEGHLFRINFQPGK